MIKNNEGKPAAQVPEGWQLVPIEPSHAMLTAAFGYLENSDEATTDGLYKIMLSTAPPHSGEKQK